MKKIWYVLPLFSCTSKNKRKKKKTLQKKETEEAQLVVLSRHTKNVCMHIAHCTHHIDYMYIILMLR